MLNYPARYKCFNKFILRSPALPINIIEEFHSVIKDYSDRIIDIIFRNEVFKEALYIASPILYNECENFIYNEVNDLKNHSDLKLSLYKYFNRMCTRCTPYGLFAGISIGKILDKSTCRVELSKLPRCITCNYLDMSIVYLLVDNLLKIPIVRNKSKYYPNNYLYKVGNQIRYIERDCFANQHIRSVETSDYLSAIIALASDGATINELSNSIADEEISIETANDFISELINNQILISELEPSVFQGNDLINFKRIKLPCFCDSNTSMQIINDLLIQLTDINMCQIGSNLQKYIKLSNSLKNMEFVEQTKDFLNVTLHKPLLSGVINKEISDSILELIEFLSYLPQEKSSKYLDKFRKKFVDKYGESEIPILVALDPEIGIDIYETNEHNDSAPLLENLYINNILKENKDHVNLDNFTLKLHDIILQAKIRNESVVHLEKYNFKKFNKEKCSLPPTFSVLFNLLSYDSITKIPLIHFIGLCGSSAVNILSRFSDTTDEIHEYLEKIAKKEESLLQDYLVCEIQYLSRTRDSNIQVHKKLYKHEIPLIAPSVYNTENSIPLSDIMISVVENKILLKLKKNNQEIMPRVANFHNFNDSSFPLYELFGELQYQGIIKNLTLPLSKLISVFGSIPRIMYKNIILSLAEWNISEEEITNLKNFKDDIKLKEETRKWRLQNKIPSKVVLKRLDHSLLIDFECVVSIRAMLKEKNFTLTEFLFDYNTAAVNSEEGAFLNEFIISYYKDEA